MVDLREFEHLKKGDVVRFTGYFRETEPDKRVSEEFTVLRAYPFAGKEIGGPFVLDTDGEFHYLKKVDSIYIKSYGAGVPNAEHIFWISADEKDGSEIRYHYAHRSGHPNNRVWEYEGRRLDQNVLLSLVGGARLYALDVRNS